MLISRVLTSLKEYLEYDPTDWSIVPHQERQILEDIAKRIPERDLSIGRVLVAARLPETPSKIQYVRSIIVKRYRGSDFF